MRISDWSSDVCSSDLHDRNPAPFALRDLGAELAEQRFNGTPFDVPARGFGEEKFQRSLVGSLHGRMVLVFGTNSQHPGSATTHHAFVYVPGSALCVSTQATCATRDRKSTRLNSSH